MLFVDLGRDIELEVAHGRGVIHSLVMSTNGCIQLVAGFNFMMGKAGMTGSFNLK